MKSVLFCSILLFVATLSYGQKNNWQNLDNKQDTTLGISTEKAYHDLLRGKKATTVIVAVIDAGVDTAHEDLKRAIWKNIKEKPDGQDNDKNGYADDLHGWSFIGSAKGNVHYDNLELVRQIRQQRVKFGDKDSTLVPAADLPECRDFLKKKDELYRKRTADANALKNIEGLKTITDRITQHIGKTNPSLTDFQDYDATDVTEDRVCNFIVSQLKKDNSFANFKATQIDAIREHYQVEMDYQLNIDYDPRPIVGDDYFNSSQRNYGCNDVTGPEADHGTHVAGIIGADRSNDKGIKGVADNVMIMSVRAVPNGDERDKDVANAIRYAANNGARIINMSFGKTYTQDKKGVDEAVKYAMGRGLLIIHAAGNDNKDLDTEQNFPNRIYADGSGTAQAWIETGASSFRDDENLKAPFSNYGKTSVDVFAPGVKINSCIPGNKYAAFDGTSMAAPVVAGLAALIMEYYPKLTAIQVKDIILKSVVKINHPVELRTSSGLKSVPFSELCNTGGIINAYQAV
jgi:subtilisin family serine protease